MRRGSTGYSIALYWPMGNIDPMQRVTFCRIVAGGTVDADDIAATARATAYPDDALQGLHQHPALGRGINPSLRDHLLDSVEEVGRIAGMESNHAAAMPRVLSHDEVPEGAVTGLAHQHTV